MEIEFRSYSQTKLNFGNSIANKQRCVSIYRVFLKRIKKTHIEKMCASLLCLISLHSPTFVSFPTCNSRFYFIKVFLFTELLTYKSENLLTKDVLMVFLHSNKNTISFVDWVHFWKQNTQTKFRWMLMMTTSALAGDWEHNNLCKETSWVMVVKCQGNNYSMHVNIHTNT